MAKNKLGLLPLKILEINSNNISNQIFTTTIFIFVLISTRKLTYPSCVVHKSTVRLC